jgi:hypothetical protein
MPHRTANVSHFLTRCFLGLSSMRSTPAKRLGPGRPGPLAAGLPASLVPDPKVANVSPPFYE